MAKSHSDLQDYSYYFVPAPWLSVKLMKLIQCFPVSGKYYIYIHVHYCFNMYYVLSTEDPITKARLVEALDCILNRAAVSYNC